MRGGAIFAQFPSFSCLPEALQPVHDGDTVALEGFTHLISLAAGREIIRRHLRGLIDMTADMR